MGKDDSEDSYRTLLDFRIRSVIRRNKQDSRSARLARLTTVDGFVSRSIEGLEPEIGEKPLISCSPDIAMARNRAQSRVYDNPSYSSARIGGFISEN